MNIFNIYTQNNRIDQKAATSHTEGSIVNTLSPFLDLTLIMEMLFMIVSSFRPFNPNRRVSIIVETLLFGLNGLNDEENAYIIESTTKYIITTERFIKPLL